jgi:hypothetical protein
MLYGVVAPARRMGCLVAGAVGVVMSRNAFRVRVCFASPERYAYCGYRMVTERPMGVPDTRKLASSVRLPVRCW